MTPENFCYWLQGKLELDPIDNRLSEDQVRMIREHLKLVFKKEVPPSSPTMGLGSLASLGRISDLGGVTC